MDITVGANQFFWSADKWSEFYTNLATTPVERIVMGELVCSKRLPFYQDRIPKAIATLTEAGKEVALTSLALITLLRERKQMAQLAEMGLIVEINDLTALAYLPKGMGFWVGPLVNVYNEGTLAWLASLGAKRICLPPELPIASVKILGTAGTQLGVAVEVWGYGRLPLAISGRCYHARLRDRAKDNCQFACEDDPDGLEIKTLKNQPFMAINGVQTLSESYACVDHQIELLDETGIASLRLSPQSKGFSQLSKVFHKRLLGALPAGAIADEARQLEPNIQLSDGFLTGKSGASWSAD